MPPSSTILLKGFDGGKGAYGSYDRHLKDFDGDKGAFEGAKEKNAARRRLRGKGKIKERPPTILKGGEPTLSRSAAPKLARPLVACVRRNSYSCDSFNLVPLHDSQDPSPNTEELQADEWYRPPLEAWIGNWSMESVDNKQKAHRLVLSSLPRAKLEKNKEASWSFSSEVDPSRVAGPAHHSVADSIPAVGYCRFEPIAAGARISPEEVYVPSTAKRPKRPRVAFLRIPDPVDAFSPSIVPMQQELLKKPSQIQTKSTKRTTKSGLLSPLVARSLLHPPTRAHRKHHHLSSGKANPNDLAVAIGGVRGATPLMESAGAEMIPNFELLVHQEDLQRHLSKTGHPDSRPSQPSMTTRDPRLMHADPHPSRHSPLTTGQPDTHPSQLPATQDPRPLQPRSTVQVEMASQTRDPLAPPSCSPGSRVLSSDERVKGLRRTKLCYDLLLCFWLIALRPMWQIHLVFDGHPMPPFVLTEGFRKYWPFFELGCMPRFFWVFVGSTLACAFALWSLPKCLPTAIVVFNLCLNGLFALVHASHCIQARECSQQKVLWTCQHALTALLLFGRLLLMRHIRRHRKVNFPSDMRLAVFGVVLGIVLRCALMVWSN